MIEQVELAIIIEEILFSTQRVKLRLNATEIAYECFKYFLFFFINGQQLHQFQWTEQRPPQPQFIEHKQDSDICRWKPMSWLRVSQLLPYPGGPSLSIYVIILLLWGVFRIYTYKLWSSHYALNFRSVKIYNPSFMMATI